jgi:hypothetical protein
MGLTVADVHRVDGWCKGASVNWVKRHVEKLVKLHFQPPAETRPEISLIVLSDLMDQYLAQHQLRAILQCFCQMHRLDFLTPH